MLAMFGKICGYGLKLCVKLFFSINLCFSKNFLNESVLCFIESACIYMAYVCCRIKSFLMNLS